MPFQPYSRLPSVVITIMHKTQHEGVGTLSATPSAIPDALGDWRDTWQQVASSNAAKHGRSALQHGEPAWQKMTRGRGGDGSCHTPIDPMSGGSSRGMCCGNAYKTDNAGRGGALNPDTLKPPHMESQIIGTINQIPFKPELDWKGCPEARSTLHLQDGAAELAADLAAGQQIGQRSRHQI